MSVLVEQIVQRLELLPEKTLRQVLAVVEFLGARVRSQISLPSSSLTVMERIQLAEDLWESVVANPDLVPLTQAQKQELDGRLERYRQDPAAGSSWDEVKHRLEQNS